MLSACWLIGAYFLAVSSHKRGRLNTSVYGSDERDFNLTDDPAEACLGNRTGVLCGECKENYSVVFGSDTCYDHCTDVYLLTIPAYMPWQDFS